MSNVEIREAGSSDALSIARIWVDANSARRGDVIAPALVDLQRFVLERMRMPSSRFFLAETVKRPVGIAHFLPAREDDGNGPLSPRLMHLSMIAVDPELWGRGIGKLLTDRCVSEAARLGYTSMQVWTHASSERARRLYASAGFRETGRDKVDEEGERIRLYSCSLWIDRDRPDPPR